MPEVVYVLCALSSLTCTALLVRGWWRTRSRLLMWSALCFGCMFLSNVVLVYDLAMTGPEVSWLIHRQLLSLVGLVMLVWGFAWDAR
jgi:hypothetical protein